MGQRGREFARIDPRAAGEPVPRRELEVAIMRKRCVNPTLRQPGSPS